MYDDFDTPQEVGESVGDSSNRVLVCQCQCGWEQVSDQGVERYPSLTGSIKKWKCPEGIFVNNFVGHEAIINTMAVNEEGVMFSGADNGSLTLWDYHSGLPFQHLKDIPQPGSLDAEAVSRMPCEMMGMY